MRRGALALVGVALAALVFSAPDAATRANRLALCMGAALAWTLYLLLRGTQWRARFDAAVESYGRGEWDLSMGEFDALAKSSASLAQHAFARYLLGSVKLRRGDLAKALELFLEIEASGGLKRHQLQHAGVCFGIAMVHALEGRLDDADRWLAEGHLRRRSLSAPGAAMVEAVLALRRNQPEQAAKVISPVLGDPDLGVFRSFAALLSSRATGAPRPPMPPSGPRCSIAEPAHSQLRN